MTNPTLDRLIEIEKILARSNLSNANQIKVQALREDAQSLKSQLESKLAQADRFEALLQFIPKNSDGHATVECIFCKRGHHEDCIGAPQNCCCGYWENKVDTPEQQELSQLRPIVQALREVIEFDESRIKDGFGYKVDLNQLKFLKKILASSEAKNETP